MSKEAAEELLEQAQRPMMIVKFSDTKLSYMIISYLLPGTGRCQPEHLLLNAADLNVVPLEKAILSCRSLSEVIWIYPDHPKKELLEKAGNSPNAQQQPRSPYARYAHKLVIGMTLEWQPPALSSNVDVYVSIQQQHNTNNAI